MKKTTKFIILGIVFHLIAGYVVTSFHFDLISGFLELNSIMYGFNAAIVITVGLLKGPSLGLAFGSSYFISSLIRFFSLGYSYRFLRMQALFLFGNSLVMAVYGYFPSKRYLLRRKAIDFAGGFLGTIFIDVILTTISYAIYLYFSGSSRYFIEHISHFILYSRTGDLVAVSFIGIISAMLSMKQLETIKMKSPSPLKVITPIEAFSKPHQTQLTCMKCGHQNPQGYNFCGKCGSPLRFDETRIY